jgi:hypothetical protein
MVRGDAAVFQAFVRRGNEIFGNLFGLRLSFRCLAHFPPGDTYESMAGVDDVSLS